MQFNCYRTDKRFRLRENLFTRKPVLSGDDGLAFATDKIPNIDGERIIYFAASVFWRAAVHRWRLQYGDTVSTDLGPYEDGLRRFLMGEDDFPEQMELIVHVIAPGVPMEYFRLPRQDRIKGYWSHAFVIPGVGFHLYVGAKLPSKVLQFSFVRSPQRPVFVSRDVDLTLLAGLGRFCREGKRVRS